MDLVQQEDKILDLDVMLTVNDIARHLQLDKRIVYNIIRSKTLSAIKIGHSYRILKSEYIRWLKHNNGKDVLL